MTSSAKRVIFGREERWDIFERGRAVAKTWRPRLEKEEPREEPIPPAVQPVMRVYLVGVDIVELELEKNGWRREGGGNEVGGTLLLYIYLRSLGMRKKQDSYV